MKFLAAVFFVIFLTFSISAQSRSNESIVQQIRELRAGDSISLTHDPASKVTTLKGVAENFADQEAKRAGVRAINFAVGAIYVGTSLERPVDPIMLSFWVLSGKPKFGGDQSLSVIGAEDLGLGNARYTARARDGMEYLNFNLTRDQITRIVAQPSARLLLGGKEFTLTAGQRKLLSDVLALTAPR